MSRSVIDHGGASRLAAWIALIAIAVWLLSPVLNGQHLEGYTTNLKAIAYMASRGDLRGQDLLMPALTDFLYFSRAGVIAMLQLGERIFGAEGDWDFRALMILSLAVVLAGSVFIARRLEGVHPIAAFATLLLIPSVTENAFFFNDNIPSAAFAIAAVALVVAWDRPAAYVVAGLFSAAAVLCRADAVLLAPFVAGVAWLRHPDWRPLLIRWSLAATGFVLGLGLGALLLRATPLDAVIASARFAVGFPPTTIILVLALTIGAAGAILLALGLWVSWQRFQTAPDRWCRVALLLLYPGLILAVTLRLGTETRYVYPLLTPFLALHGGRGLELLVAALSGSRRRLAQAGIAVLALIAFLPPAVVIVRDGPRSPTGRIWAPVLWWQWQDAMAGSMHRVEATVREAEGISLTVLISMHFNDEFFLKQRLLAAGWRPRPAGQVFPGCRGFSAYEKDESTLAHIRTEQQYGLLDTDMTRMRAFMIDQSLSCPALRSADRTLLTTWGRDHRVQRYSHSFDPRLVGPVLPLFQPLAILSVRLTSAEALRLPPWSPRPADESVGTRQLQGTYHSRLLSSAAVERLAQDAAAFLRRPLQPEPGGVDSFISWPGFMEAYRARCDDPDRSSLADVPLCLGDARGSEPAARP